MGSAARQAVAGRAEAPQRFTVRCPRMHQQIAKISNAGRCLEGHHGRGGDPQCHKLGAQSPVICHERGGFICAVEPQRYDLLLRCDVEPQRPYRRRIGTIPKSMGCHSYREFLMQAAIDRILRSFSSKAAAADAANRPAEMSRDDAFSLAAHLLDNYRAQLAVRAKPH